MQDFVVVIPFYNESKRFEERKFIDFVQATTNFTFVLVNDGSTDDTISILKKIESIFPEKIFVLDNSFNQGKGESCRKGLVYAIEKLNSTYAGYIDADFATPLTELYRGKLIFDTKQDEVQVLIGSRIKKLGSRINRNPTRHYLGRVFATLISILLRLPIYDSQCGFKFFKTEILKPVLRDKFISKWFFDVEILLRIKLKYGSEFCLKHFYEIPLTEWNEIKGSKIKFSDFISVPLELLRIKYHYKI